MKKSSLIGVVLSVMILVQPIYGCTSKDSNPRKDSHQSGNNNRERVITTTLFQSGKVITRDSNDDPVLEVIMQLSQESYGMRPLYAPGPMAYHVTMLVTNKGKKDIKYDQIISAFIPPTGNELSMKTSPFVKGKDGSSIKADASNPFILTPGKTENYDFTSNGYTDDLLASANGEPLVFVMIILSNEQVVYKTPKVELPALGDLPMYELTLIGGSDKPLTKKLTP